MDNMQLLQKRLSKVEKELSTCRTSVMQDGWQTQRHAKKARKWDMLAEEKRKLLARIDELCDGHCECCIGSPDCKYP